jgi:hypothetical protein
MGMFDYVRVETQLPDFHGNVVEAEFQTKDFDNALERYVITQKGELYREHWEYKWVDDDNHFLKGYPEKLPGTYRRIYLTDFHGDVTLLTEMENGVYREYHCRFTDGRLTKVWYNNI